MEAAQKQTLSMLMPNFSAAQDLIVPHGKLAETLKADIESADSGKFLVAGQRGMGKTTELRRLSALLEGDHLSIFVQFGSQEAITHPLLLQAMAVGLLNHLPRSLSARVVTRFQDWFAKEEESRVSEEGSEGSASIGGKVLVLKAEKGIRHKDKASVTKTSTKSKTLSDLVGRFNDLLQEGNKVAKLPLVFIVDDIDKIQDPASIEDTFIHASHIINSIAAPCVFTVPITAATSSLVRMASLAYADVYRVPAVDVLLDNGSPNERAIGFIIEVLKRRMPYNPIPEGTLRQIVLYSGGVLIDAMRLARGLCKSKILDADFPVDPVALEGEFQKLVDAYKFVFDRHLLWEKLALICKADDKRVIMTDDALPELLYKMIAIEYPGETLWFDLHPAARRLYEQNADVIAKAF